MESDTSYPRGYIGTLDMVPDIAAKLGHYLAQMTGFEMVLHKYLGRLAGIGTPGVTNAIFHNIMSIAVRIDIIADLAKMPHNAKYQPKLNGLISDIRAINSKRNKYMHGAYKVDVLSKTVTLVTWIETAKRPSEAFFVTEASLSDDIQQVMTFLGDSFDLFDPDLPLEPFVY